MHIAYKEAITRPFTDWKKTLLGMLIMAVPILNFAGYGFAMETIRNPHGELPSWKPFGRRFVEGFKALLISLFYLIPVFALFVPLALQEQPSVVLGGIVLVLGALISYVLPAGWMAFAREERFGAAFALGRVLKTAFSKNYVVAMLVLLIVSIGLGVIGGILHIILAITFIGPWLVNAFISFVSLVILGSLLGMVAEQQ